MKTTTEQKNSRGIADRLLPAFCVFCAAGAAITGTMLLLENSESPPVPVASQNEASAPAKNPLLNPMLNDSAAQAPNAQAPNTAAPFADALPQAAPEAAAPDGSAPDAHPHGPPPSTVGMPPAQAALLMANWHYDVKHWNEAILKYQETIAAGLDNADVRTDLGNCYRFSEQPQKALEQYRLAQKQNPKHENSLFNQAGVFVDMNQPQRGVAIWNAYLQRFPKGQNVSRAKQLLERYSSAKP
jgi:tetratricopeptide (TPR) repeat protein